MWLLIETFSNMDLHQTWNVRSDYLLFNLRKSTTISETNTVNLFLITTSTS